MVQIIKGGEKDLEEKIQVKKTNDTCIIIYFICFET